MLEPVEYNRVKKLFNRYRYTVILLKQLVKTDFKLRYQNSVLGYLWSLLRPLFLFLILYLVFTVFLPVGDGVPHYAVYLLLGIVLWSYFAEVTSSSVGAIVGKGDILRKINFPRYVIILAISFSALINLALNFLIIAVFMVVGRVSLGWEALAILPLILELFVFSIAVGFFLSALFVRFRDLSYIWEILMQAGFYGTPILYPMSKIDYPAVQKILLMNPMAQIIQDARYVLVTPSTDTIGRLWGNPLPWLIPIVLTAVVVVIAGAYFRSRSKFFAEDV